MGVLLWLAAGPALAVPLWKVEGEAGTVFLLGSIHALTPDHYPLPARVKRVYERADRVIFEVDLTRLSQPEMAAITREYGAYRPPRTLQTELSDETLAALSGYLERRRLTMQEVNTVKPWLLALQISIRELQRAGYNPAFGLDMHLMQRAIGDGKQLGELETFREQMSALSADPPAVQELALREVIDGLDGFDAELKEMITAWEDADIDALYQMAVEMVEEEPALGPQVERIVHERNDRMVESIVGLLEAEGTTLVVVGALHLGGDRGIISILSRSFEVTEITE